MLKIGIGTLNNLAAKAGNVDYVSTGWEADRVKMLKSIESTNFFSTIRGGLVVGIYNQLEVWKRLGYEGSSFEHGGYLTRGFDDIAWL